MPARMRLSSVYSTLPPAERRVADFILSKQDSVSHMIINEIAEGAGVSLPSVTRLAKRLGYDGFMDFRVALASGGSAIGDPCEEPVAADDEDEVFVHKLMVGQMRAIESTLRILNKPGLCGLAENMVNSRRIVWFGVGGALDVAVNISSNLVRMGLDSTVMREENCMKAYVKRLGKGDLFFGISRTGATQKTLECLEEAKKNGATTAFMTNLINSPAENTADYFICTSRLDDLYRLCGFETNSAQNALLEVLSFLIAKKLRHIARTDFVDLLTKRE